MKRGRLGRDVLPFQVWSALNYGGQVSSAYNYTLAAITSFHLESIVKLSNTTILDFQLS